jgi:hypothetical protein
VITAQIKSKQTPLKAGIKSLSHIIFRIVIGLGDDSLVAHVDSDDGQNVRYER